MLSRVAIVAVWSSRANATHGGLSLRSVSHVAGFGVNGSIGAFSYCVSGTAGRCGA